MGTEKGKRLNLSRERLWKLCQEGIPEGYPVCFMQHAETVLSHEFKIVCRFGQVEEFLAAAGIRQFAGEQGIPCRLSFAGCSSIISHLLKLTDVSPIFLDLCFERFRDPQGRWAANFCFDVPLEHRQAVLDFANEHYGQEFFASKFNFLEMSPSVRIPYVVANLVRQELQPGFTLRSIWKARAFHPDRRVFQMLSSGDIDGIYWLEAENLAFLQRLNPISLNGLTDFMALYLLSRDHPELCKAYLEYDCVQEFSGDCLRPIRSILSATKGLILYQEQIMSLLGLLGKKWFEDSFTFLGAVGKKQHQVVAEYRNRFLAEAPKTCHLGNEEVVSLFDRIHEAATYVCCKAARAAEAMTTYQASYLKYHYPDLFQRALQDLRDGK